MMTTTTTIQPEIVLISADPWISIDDTQRIDEVFEIRGGDVALEWALRLRAPEAPWCRVTMVSSDWQSIARAQGGGTYLASFGGSVWQSAWPQLFEARGRYGVAGHRLTLLAETLFEMARQAAARIGGAP